MEEWGLIFEQIYRSSYEKHKQIYIYFYEQHVRDLAWPKRTANQPQSAEKEVCLTLGMANWERECGGATGHYTGIHAENGTTAAVNTGLHQKAFSE